MKTNNKEQVAKNILPWIEDGSYKSEEWQKRIEETMKKIRGNEIPDGVMWYPNGRAVI